MDSLHWTLFGILLFLAVALITAGCASVNFNPETGEVAYTRIGDQHIQGFSASKKADGGYTVKLDSQQSQAEALVELIKLIRALSSPVGVP